MTAQPAEAPAKPARKATPEWFYIRNVRFCNDKAGNPVLEIPFKDRGIHLVHPEDKEALEFLGVVGITCHDGGKFFLGDKPMEFDKYTPIDFQVEVLAGLTGRQIIGVKPLKLDDMPAGGMTDNEFMEAWNRASGIVPPLKTVAADPAMWLPRVNRILVEFYGQNGYGRDKGQTAADLIVEQIKAANMSGDIPFVQSALKNRLREEFPGGKPMPKEKTFDLEGSQADIGILIADEASNRKPFRMTIGKTLEGLILGTNAMKFVTDQASYDSAKSAVTEFFEYYDLETDLLRGISANEKDAGISVDDLAGILKDVLNKHGAATTFDAVQVPDYDQSLILAAHHSAIEAFKTKDVPKFENGIKDDASTLADLKNADIKTDDTPSPDENLKFADRLVASGEAQRIMDMPPIVEPPQEQPAPKFTAEEWSKWLADQKQDYPEIKPADIMQILEITRASDWMPRTLKDAAEKLKRTVEVRRADALLEDAKRILKDKDVPLEAWGNIIAEAGDPKLFTDTSYSKTNYQGKVLTLANAYVTAHATPKPESAMVPVDPNPPSAIVPAAPPSYGVLAALKLPTPSEMQVMAQLADAIVGSALFRGVDTTPRAIAIMLKALQWGIGAIEAFENIYIIPNKKGDQLYPSTNLLRARVMAHPACLRFDVTGDEKKATAIVWRKGDDAPVSFSYSIEDAKQAGLLETYDDGNLKRGTWGTNPKAMLAHRVGRLAVMAKFPDVAIGLLPQSDEE